MVILMHLWGTLKWTWLGSPLWVPWGFPGETLGITFGKLVEPLELLGGKFGVTLIWLEVNMGVTWGRLGGYLRLMWGWLVDEWGWFGLTCGALSWLALTNLYLWQKPPTQPGGQLFSSYILSKQFCVWQLMSDLRNGNTAACLLSAVKELDPQL